MKGFFGERAARVTKGGKNDENGYRIVTGHTIL